MTKKLKNQLNNVIYNIDATSGAVLYAQTLIHKKPTESATSLEEALQYLNEIHNEVVTLIKNS